eukprot:m.85790 g.85790  ORF g.85790 m.85790 type:complete len:373 (+) comp13024_c0_seq2:236-1354(+)
MDKFMGLVEFYNEGNFDSSLESLLLHDMKPGTKQKAVPDRGTVVMKYNGVNIKWGISFCGLGDKGPPDFFFDDTRFMPLSSLACLSDKWNTYPKKYMLGHIMRELLKEYKKHQHKLVALHDSQLIQYEYAQTVVPLSDEKRNYTADVATEEIGNGHRVVFFKITLTNIHDNLGNCSLKKLVQDSPPVLYVKYSPTSAGQFEAKPFLSLSPKIKEEITHLECPPWRSGYLLGYIELVQKSVEEDLQTHVNGHIARRRFVASFLSHFGSAMLEYDVEQFKWIYFLFEVVCSYLYSFTCHRTCLKGSDNVTLVGIKLLPKFPEMMPKIVLKNLSKESSQPVTLENPGDYPYSPRWSMEEMATRTRELLKQRIMPS